MENQSKSMMVNDIKSRAVANTNQQISEILDTIQPLTHEIHLVNAPTPNALAPAIDKSMKYLGVSYTNEAFVIYSAFDGRRIVEHKLSASVRGIGSTEEGAFRLFLSDGSCCSLAINNHFVQYEGKLDSETFRDIFWIKVLPAGHIVASHKKRNLVQIFPERNQITHLISFQDDIQFIQWIDEKVVLVNIGTTKSIIKGYDVEEKKELFFYKAEKKITALAASQRYLALKDEDGNILVFNLAHGPLNKPAFSYEARSVAKQMVTAIAQAAGEVGFLNQDMTTAFENRAREILKDAELAVHRDGTVTIVDLRANGQITLGNIRRKESITTFIKRGLNSAYKAVLSKTHRALLK